MQPIIILVTPQLGENIGMAARAMLNCGLSHMRLVAPRDGWPNEKGISAASGAFDLMPQIQVFDTTSDAIADCNFIYATSGKLRHMAKPVYTGDAAAADMKERVESGQKVAVLFGAERTGLLNEDLMLGNAFLNFPTNPDFSSLNLSQAVLLVAYEWLKAHDETAPRRYETQEHPPATMKEMEEFMVRLEHEIGTRGFFQSADMRPAVMRNLQTMLRRAEMSAQDIRTFHGIISILIGKKQKP